MLGTNIGAYITTRFGLQRTAFGAGQGGNIGATNGTAIQRTLKRPLHVSAKVVVGWKATLASGNSLVLTIQPKHSEAGSVYEDLGDEVEETITALNSGAAQTGTVEVDVNLIGAHDYIRVTATPVLSASGVDTGEVFAVWVLGGGETIPPTEEDA